MALANAVCGTCSLIATVGLSGHVSLKVEGSDANFISACFVKIGLSFLETRLILSKDLQRPAFVCLGKNLSSASRLTGATWLGASQVHESRFYTVYRRKSFKPLAC